MIRTLPIPGETIAIARDGASMVEAFRIIKTMLNLTNAHCDELGGLAGSGTDKYLGPTGEKEIGMLTFSKFCDLFAVEFHMRIDMGQVARMEQYWDDRQRRRPAEYSQTSRVSAKLIEKAKPHVAKAMGRAGGRASGAMRSGSHGSEIMRKLAKFRWRKPRRRRLVRNEDA